LRYFAGSTEFLIYWPQRNVVHTSSVQFRSSLEKFFICHRGQIQYLGPRIKVGPLWKAVTPYVVSAVDYRPIEYGGLSYCSTAEVLRPIEVLLENPT
jgi:hypothetical protein